MIHLRFKGRSYDFTKAQLNLNGNMNDTNIKTNIARFLEVNPTELNAYVIDHRPNGEIIVRPEAVYG